ncbi:MAG: PIN domain-containing protein [Bacteroidia bacterium]|nr:PIN domain-containing protein [Bacteroidia bacterium]
MHKLFLDTNILLDWIFDRPIHGEFAKKVIALGEEKRVKLYCSAISISDFNYIAFQSIRDKKKVSYYIELMTEIIQVEPSFHKDIVQAVHSQFNDLEDAFQYFTAIHINGLTAIITRNKKDFKNSKIKTLTSEEYLKNYW